MYLLLLGTLLVTTLRMLFILPGIRRNSNKFSRRRRRGKAPRRPDHKILCIVLGSGGHTAEMVRFLRDGIGFDRYNQRMYMVGTADMLSQEKIGRLEDEVLGEYHVGRIPRSRRVGQSYLTSIWTSLQCFICCQQLVARYMPDAILCNGPGNCVLVCLAGLLLRFFGVKHIPVVYVESFARVHTLSLSGKIMYYLLADRFIVQWPYLQVLYPRAEYIPNLS